MDSMIIYYFVFVIIQNIFCFIGGIINILIVVIIVLNIQSIVLFCGLFDYLFICFYFYLECILFCGQYKYLFFCLYYYFEYMLFYEQYNFMCNYYYLKLIVQFCFVDS